MPGLGEHGEWTDRPIQGLDERLWAPSWAAELLDQEPIAGVVIGVTTEETDAIVDRMVQWRPPLLVSNSVPQHTRAHALAAGAFVGLSTPLQPDETLVWVRNLLAFRADLDKPLPVPATASWHEFGGGLFGQTKARSGAVRRVRRAQKLA